MQAFPIYAIRNCFVTKYFFGPMNANCQGCRTDTVDQNCTENTVVICLEVVVKR